MKNPFAFIVTLFRKPTAYNIAQEKLDQARIHALQHTEAANYHQHLRLFYEQQIQQLDQFVNGGVPKGIEPDLPFPSVEGLASVPAPVRRPRTKPTLAAAT